VCSGYYSYIPWSITHVNCLHVFSTRVIYLHQADNELRITTSQLKRVTFSFDESNDLFPAINSFGDVTVTKIIDHTITHKTLKEEQAQFVPDKTTTLSTFKLQNRIEGTGRGITGMVVTDDDHLLLCDYSSENSKLVALWCGQLSC
jgi:hypothetical protein